MSRSEACAGWYESVAQKGGWQKLEEKELMCTVPGKSLPHQ